MKSYAAHFEWFEKDQKELGVAEELLAALERSGARTLSSLQSFSPDPPDCICLDSAGRSVAIEVAELVCETATRLNAQGHDVYRQWQAGELAAAVAEQLAAKDVKSFHGGPYHEIVACLFTDEPALTLDQAERELGNALFGPFAQLSAAYLLFSYDPGTRTRLGGPSPASRAPVT